MVDVCQQELHRVGHEDLWSVLHDVDCRCSSIECMSCHILTHLGLLSTVLAYGWDGFLNPSLLSMRKLSPHRFVFSTMLVGLF